MKTDHFLKPVEKWLLCSLDCAVYTVSANHSLAAHKIMLVEPILTQEPGLGSSTCSFKCMKYKYTKLLISTSTSTF